MNKAHIATFMGAINKKRYEYGSMMGSVSSYEPKIVKEVFEVDYEIIQSEQFCNPPMSQGEKVCLESIDKNVIVNEVVRDSDGGYIYYTSHVIKVIEDEETQHTLYKAEKEQLRDENENLKKRVDWLLRNLEKSTELNNKFEQNENLKKKFYQFWK